MYNELLDSIYRIAQNDSRLIFIGSDLKPETLNEMKINFSDRFFMEGISEANTIGMAAGLACDGFIPFINGIAAFMTRRCFEQIALDVCLHNLPVRIVGIGGGLSYSVLGPTHMGVEDISILRTLPNLTILVPANSYEMKELIRQSIDWNGPIYIRISKEVSNSFYPTGVVPKIGEAVVFQEHSGPTDILIISTGHMTTKCYQAAQALSKEGISISHLHIHSIEPFDTQCLLKFSVNARAILIVEENSIVGGLGSLVTETIAASSQTSLCKIKILGIPKRFLSNYGSHDEQLNDVGLNIAQIIIEIKSLIL